MTATRNNRGASHENGAVESPHGHLKRRITQALLLRESADVASLEDYRQWLDALVGRFNHRTSEALAVERGRLQALPARRTTDYSEQVVAVTTSGTIEVTRVLYSVLARQPDRHLQPAVRRVGPDLSRPDDNRRRRRPLVHHATIIEVSSDSYRRKEALGQVAARTATAITPTTTTTPASATTTAPVSGDHGRSARRNRSGALRSGQRWCARDVRQ